jgi:hypothetical protein
MLSLTTNGCAAGFTLNEFKELFRSDSLIESQGYDESEALLEKAYSVYEIGMLQEAKSHWFDENKPQIYEHSRGVISYLEFEGNILLFKDGEAFMVNERSLNMIHDQDQSINENLFDLVIGDKLYEWTWGDNPLVNGIKGAAKWANTNIVQPAAKIVKTYVVDPLKSAWDALSTGAKKVYEFAKKILSAIGTFIKENWQDIVFYITVALQVIAGIVAFIPAAGQVVGCSASGAQTGFAHQHGRIFRAFVAAEQSRPCAGASGRDTTAVLARRADGDVGHAPGWLHVDGQRGR